MNAAGVILYGPPGAGKDTVTAELVQQDPSYALFERLKAGPGRTPATGSHRSSTSTASTGPERSSTGMSGMKPSTRSTAAGSPS